MSYTCRGKKLEKSEKTLTRRRSSLHLVEVSDDCFVVDRVEDTLQTGFPTAQTLDDDRNLDLLPMMCCTFLERNPRRHFHLPSESCEIATSLQPSSVNASLVVTRGFRGVAGANTEQVILEKYDEVL